MTCNLAHLPQEFTKHSGRKLRVLPTAEPQQFDGVLRVTAVLDYLLNVAGAHKQDVNHHLLQWHDGSCDVGVTIWVWQGRVTYKKDSGFRDPFWQINYSVYSIVN